MSVRKEADLNGRTAIVTGAGGGIGRATALLLAERGAQVIVNDIGRTPDGHSTAQRVVEEILALGGHATSSTESVADFDSAGEIVATALRHYGGLDILVNNAGIGWNGQLWTLDPNEFEKVTASHIKGTYNCARHAVLPMREQGFGRIINMVSRAGLHGLPGTLAYAVGKGGVFGFTNAASLDLAPYGITVNAVNPSSTATPMVLSAIETLEQRDEEGRQRAANLRSAMQAPEQVAVVVAFLATPRAGAITGQVFLAEGNRIGVFQPLTVTQEVERQDSWTVDELGDALVELEYTRGLDPYE